MDKTIFCTSTYATNLEAFLGDYPNERNHMGADIPVFVYRLFQYSLKEVPNPDGVWQNRCRQSGRQLGKGQLPFLFHNVKLVLP